MAYKLLLLIFPEVYKLLVLCCLSFAIHTPGGAFSQLEIYYTLVKSKFYICHPEGYKLLLLPYWGSQVPTLPHWASIKSYFCHPEMRPIMGTSRPCAVSWLTADRITYSKLISVRRIWGSLWLTLTFLFHRIYRYILYKSWLPVVSYGCWISLLSHGFLFFCSIISSLL